MTTTEITLAVPGSAAEAAVVQREAEADVRVYGNWECPDADGYALADRTLTDVVHRKDQVKAMRDRAVVPLKQSLQEIEGWFKPALTALEKCESALKGAMSRYLVQREASAEADGAEAMRLLAEGNGAEAVEALENLYETPVGRATQRWVWAVKAIDPSKVNPTWMIPDEKRIKALARGHKGPTPPVCAGVTFERQVQIGAKR